MIRLEVREDPQNDHPMELAEFIMGGRHDWSPCDWSKPVFDLGLGPDRIIPGAFTISSMIKRDRDMLDEGKIAMPDESLGGIYFNGGIRPEFDFSANGPKLLEDAFRALAVDCPFNLIMPMPNPASEQLQNNMDRIISQVALVGTKNNMRPNFIVIGDMRNVIRILQLVKQPAPEPVDEEKAANEIAAKIASRAQDAD